MRAREVHKRTAQINDLCEQQCDSYYNQFPCKVRVSSTTKTEQIYYGDKYYKWYPMIREEDIGSDTSDVFVDTVNISNLYLKAIGGDYDGDQTSVKGVFTEEANAELIKHINSKANYIDLGGKNVRVSTNEAIQCLYNLTLALPGTELKMV